MAHRPELVRYASAIVGDQGRAEDVVQEAWIRLSPMANLRPLEEPVGYLFRVVRNLAVDGRRRQQREAAVVQSAHPEPQHVADVRPTADLTIQQQDDLRLLAEAMAELPERTRIALEMRRHGGHTLKRIAEHLGVSVTVAHGIVADGIAHCRRRVRPPSAP